MSNLLENDNNSQNKWGDSNSSSSSTSSSSSSSNLSQAAKQGHNLLTQQSIKDYMADLSGSDDEVDSEHDFDQGELDDESIFETPKYPLSGEENESPDLQNVDPETQARLEALLQAAGIGAGITADGRHLADPEVLRKLTSSVSCALDEAAAALNRMRAENHMPQGDASLVDACNDGDAGTVKKLLEEGKSVNETTEEGDSLLSLACQAGYYELAQVLLAMRANVEDRGIKGDCTPLMEAANAGHLDIVKLLITHNADVNAQSSSGNTPLMYACAGGHEEVAKFLLESGANVEDHNENGHTPLMEAASAGHVGVAKILLDHGAGVNTHSNEFKESALTLACYKGHLEMVRFLLEAGADQEHKTDEMHTALMEASMDGHVEVAKLLLDSGAQVNMPADSFESPLTLAACGGHVELALLLLERGANIEEVNDEGYTALMEAAREGHEEMVALLLSQGADINAQTEETQETALTLASCGGFLEVADFLIKAGADIELGASTPLMEAAQEGRLELVKYLINCGAVVNAATQTNDSALTYACENGHTDVADVLLQAGAALEHESEGGRTPLMKSARAGHVCTVQFLLSRGSNINKQTTNNDHTPLSLACAGGHLVVVELLLNNGADITHKLKDNSTMLIEAAKGGHTAVVQLLLDYPHSLTTIVSPPEVSQLSTPTFEGAEGHRVPPHGMPMPVLAEADQSSAVTQTFYHNLQSGGQASGLGKQEIKSQLLRNANTSVRQNEPLTTAELQQVKNAPHLAPAFSPDFNYDFDGTFMGGVGVSEVTLQLNKDGKPNETLEACISNMMKKAEQIHINREEQIIQKQQILEELQRVERELQDKAQAQLLLNAQTQLRLESSHTTGLCLGQGCSSSTSVTEQCLPETHPDSGQGASVSETCQIDSNVKNGVPSPPIPLPPCLLEIQNMCPKRKFKVTPKKESKVSQKEVNLQLQQHQQQQLKIIEEIEKLSVNDITSEQFVSDAFRGLQLTPTSLGLQLSSSTSLSYSDHLSVDGQKLYSEIDPASFVRPMSPLPSGTQVESQDSAVLSVGLDPFAPYPTIQTEESKTKNYKSLTQVNHLANVGTCPVLGPLPQMPATSLPVVSPQHFVPTSTVATQYIDPSLPTSSLSVPYPVSATAPATTQAPPRIPLIDINSQTDSNHDTALTLACAGGHEDLVQLLLSRGAEYGADFEHRDKKGFTPLILAATAGHAGVVEILLSHGAEIEAQSERTKDTPLSLACSGGRYEVVELLLNRSANKEHRNVSDYTPLSLAASGGYVNIIKLLLNHGAEINSRTGSKLGISPLMLAAMNGHTAAVRLLLDMGSDINAQIETNRNTALTLACFQGRQEVVSLLVDRKANVEHRAKTGLTPLMEAASGGYVEVGRVLLDKGADVNASPVPSSRDTALTIAADKGHYRFVELLLTRAAQVEVKNKKGNSPLWLAANGGHLDVAQLLVSAGADIDSQDNRKVSCLMAAFRKGHVKVVKWMVKMVTQFPSDQEMTRYMTTVSDADLNKKCQQCLETIRSAKDRQAVEANKNASSLLEELDKEKTREESKKAAAARRRERRRKKKKEKQEKKMEEENKKNDVKCQEQDIEKIIPIGPPAATLITTVGSVGLEEDQVQLTKDNKLFASVKLNKIKVVKLPTKDEQTRVSDSSSQSEKSDDDKVKLETAVRKGRGDCKYASNRGGIGKNKERERVPFDGKLSKEKSLVTVSTSTVGTTSSHTIATANMSSKHSTTTNSLPTSAISSVSTSPSTSYTSSHSSIASDRKRDAGSHHSITSSSGSGTDEHSSYTLRNSNKSKKIDGSVNSTSHRIVVTLASNLKNTNVGLSSPKRGAKREEDWKEVVRNPYSSRAKKVLVPPSAISRVIGRGGCNINTIREVSGAVIEVEKQKTVGDRSIIIRGSTEATRQAYYLINSMVKDPDKDLCDIIPKALGVKTVPSLKPTPMSTTTVIASQIPALTTTVLQGRTSVVSTSGSKSVNLPPSGAISSMGFPSPQPPFSAPVRQSQAVRPGLGMSPAFSNNSPWLNFPVPTFPKRNSQATVTTSPFQSDSSSTESTSSGSKLISRQLFSQDKKTAVTSISVSSTSTKSTVSYTTAVMGNGKVTKTIACNSGTTFASKVTESKSTCLAVTSTATPLSQTSKLSVSTTISNGSGPRTSTLPSMMNSHASRSTSLPNGPVIGSAPSQGPTAFSSQPGTPTSSLSGVSFSQPRPSTPPFMTTPPPTNVTQEFSPFNNIFSVVTHQSVWGKEKENKGMNFASVTAGKANPGNQTGLVNTSGASVVDDVAPVADASKAPGYRGNAHISPGSSASLVSDPVSPNARSHLPSNVSCSTPIGPIGSVMRKSSPVDSTILSNCSSPASASGNLSSINSVPGSVNSTLNIHLLQSTNPIAPIAPPNIQRPPVDYGKPFVAHSPTPNMSGAFVGNNGTSSSYSVSQTSNAIGHHNSQNSIPTIQSNLNPNAPDFASRNMMNSMGGGGMHSANIPQPMSHMARLQENTAAFHVPSVVGPNPSPVMVPNYHPVNLAAMASSQSSVSPNNPAQVPLMNSSQNSSMKLNYQHGHQQNNQMTNTELMAHFTRSDQMRMMKLAPRLGVNPMVMNQMSQFAPIMSGQRKGNGPHSVAPNSKEDSSSISPVSSPQPSSPSSPLTLSNIPDHSMRPIGEDRKLPRPIGTERKKNPMLNTNEMLWRNHHYGSSSDLNRPEDRSYNVTPTYMPHYADAITAIEHNHHQQLHAPHMAEINSNSRYMINGAHQQMMQQMPPMYNQSAGEYWKTGNNMKVAPGEHGVGILETAAAQMPIGMNQVPGSYPVHTAGSLPQQPPSDKMVWNSWNHMPM
ncbi:hypothetical protein CHUAL_002439 [Chamberlinius hualienensis]